MAQLDPTITAAPILRNRQDGDGNVAYIGWYTDAAGNWSSATCDSGESYAQGPTYVGCWDSDNPQLSVPVGCNGGTISFTSIYSGGKTSTYSQNCTDAYGSDAHDTSSKYCNTMFQFENSGDSSGKTGFWCDSSPQQWTYYRVEPPQAYSNNQYPTDPPKSKAWIAGAVVGPVVGLALIIGIVWWILRRRRRKQAGYSGEIGGASMGPMGVPNGVGGDVEAKPDFYRYEAGSNARHSQYSYAPGPTYAEAPASPAAKTPLLQPPGGATKANHVEPTSTNESHPAELGGATNANHVEHTLTNEGHPAELGGDGR